MSAMARLHELFGLAYPGLKHTHIGLVITSGGLFTLRWLATLAGARWPMAATWRHTSMVIDSLLLLAGATLWLGLGLNPLVQHWLGVKLLLLVAYIVLGTFALKRARGGLARALCGVAALAVLLTMVTIARHHDPAGWLRDVFARADAAMFVTDATRTASTRLDSETLILRRSAA